MYMTTPCILACLIISNSEITIPLLGIRICVQITEQSNTDTVSNACQQGNNLRCIPEG